MLRKLNLMPTLLVLITFTITACSGGGGGGGTAEEQASDHLTASAGLSAPVVEQTATSDTTDPKSAVSKKLEADLLQNNYSSEFASQLTGEIEAATANIDNDYLNIIPATLDAALESAVDSTYEGTEQDQLIEQIFSSILSNVEGDELLANSSANSRTASASSEQSYLILLDSVSEVVVRRAGESTSRLNSFVRAFIKSLPATGRSVAEIEQNYSSPVMTYITQRVIHHESEQGTTVTMLSALSVIFVDGFSQLPLSSDYQSNLATRVESVMTPVVSSTAGSDRDFSTSVDTIFSSINPVDVSSNSVVEVPVVEEELVSTSTDNQQSATSVDSVSSQFNLLINNGESSTSQELVNLTLSAVSKVALPYYLLSEDPETPSPTSSGWVEYNQSNTAFNLSTASSPGTFSRTVHIWFKDAEGNISGGASDSIDLVVADTTAPTAASVVLAQGVSSLSSTVGDRVNVQLDLAATDDVGVTHFLISESNSVPSATAASWVAYQPSRTITLTVASSAGTITKTMHVWFKDAAGNVSAGVSDSVELVVTEPVAIATTNTESSDAASTSSNSVATTESTVNDTEVVEQPVADTTAPTLVSVELDGGAGTTSNTSVTMALSATDDVGVSHYFASETFSTPTADQNGWSDYQSSVSFTLTGASSIGTYPRTVYVWFKDAYGNISAGISDSISLVVLDTEAPSALSVSIDNGTSTTSNSTVQKL